MNARISRWHFHWKQNPSYSYRVAFCHVTLIFQYSQFKGKRRHWIQPTFLLLGPSPHFRGSEPEKNSLSLSRSVWRVREQSFDFKDDCFVCHTEEELTSDYCFLPAAAKLWDEKQWGLWRGGRGPSLNIIWNPSPKYSYSVIYDRPVKFALSCRLHFVVS